MALSGWQLRFDVKRWQLECLVVTYIAIMLLIFNEMSGSRAGSGFSKIITAEFFWLYCSDTAACYNIIFCEEHVHLIHSCLQIQKAEMLVNIFHCLDSCRWDIHFANRFCQRIAPAQKKTPFYDMTKHVDDVAGKPFFKMTENFVFQFLIPIINQDQQVYFLIALRNDTRSHDYHMMRLMTRATFFRF